MLLSGQHLEGFLKIMVFYYNSYSYSRDGIGNPDNCDPKKPQKNFSKLLEEMRKNEKDYPKETMVDSPLQYSLGGLIC